MSKQVFTTDYINLLLALLHTNTITPMETGEKSETLKAQQLYADYALGHFNGMCDIVHHASSDPLVLQSEHIPLTIRERAKQMGHLFWDNQPNLVLRFGKERSIEETMMFNFHMDTVANFLPVTFDGKKFCGRGAVDMKGPGVAVLAGIEAALKQKDDLLDDLSILVQCVSGEEGGAMGVYGTKSLVEQGYFGRFNLFAEPSAGVYFDHSSTSMTARIDVSGNDSTDDAPHNGHNATLLLGYLSQWLMKQWSTRIEDRGGKMCLAGVHTGHMHNKVFGTGQLLMNFAYVENKDGDRIKNWVETEIDRALTHFRQEFSAIPTALLTVKEAQDICRLTWIKHGLPVLNNRSSEIEQFLNQLGFVRNSEKQLNHAFTCDAMWAQRSDIYTVVYGPGSLNNNNAHAEGEFITLKELEEYSSNIGDLLVAYSNLPLKKELRI
ncbi:M20/M25/M40 family metallo-hydrolase [Bacillus sp. WMMC1349]|uniref:M20/M25/M40 family metallo-hydrolase n=1 Tax=Bacillus sp. WMMC1349 TaxID=2736254 RepID=UPI001552D13D|nr:M20/M25/M40 family metallo-hydrolase [Bacillus sp. WMMC1349]NPC91338.1 M20/M25/M40 family metallo-hydrolase [Bacillus sp. WMMC1349]